ncbi:hypothetical protein Mgra_00009289 [Meloidogyne graminicola]|uniref:Uncharacterized protein n=1 Tax=Meloidogyne graminicola TaxID=189291 RepID=A0A8S9ZDD0_9BILA|nr:hypothetical protein Mgra_00009289 [Meloidogyne graminicola]
MFFYKRNILIILFYFLFLIKNIKTNKQCEEPCIDMDLKPECKGIYKDNKQLAFHFFNNFYAKNEIDSLRHYIAIEIIIWHKHMDEILNNVRDWYINAITIKLRKWTVDIWNKWQNQFDKPYCFLFNKYSTLSALKVIRRNTPGFIIRMFSSIEELQKKDKTKQFNSKELGEAFFLTSIQVF